MKVALPVGAALFAAAAVFCPATALAITLRVEPATPVAVGQSRTFRVVAVDDASGDVTLTWNFGDGTPAVMTTAREAAHTFSAAGHYTVIVQASDADSRTSASFVQTAHYPLTTRPPTSSSSLIVDEKRGRAFSVNPDHDSISALDLAKMTLVREIRVGKEPHALAQAADGSIWVANQMSDEIVVINPDSYETRSKIALPYASQPRGIAFGGSGKAYVSLYATGKLVEIDAASGKVERELAVGPTPAGVSVAADGRIFVTRFISAADRGEIWVVNPQTLTVAKTIPLAFDQSPDTESSGRGVPNYVSSTAISPDGTQAWVTAKKDNTARGRQRDGQPMTSDSFVRALICVIDLKKEAEALDKREDIDNRSLPVAVAFSPSGDYAYVLAQASNWIGIYDAYSVLNLGGIKQVGNAPDGMALTSNGRLFVNAFLSRSVIAYDLTQSLASIDHIAPPALGMVRTVDRETLSESVLLGKQVFFNAADTRMSNDGYMSCVSCHYGGYSDGRVWDFTDRGEGLRNTKSLLGIRGAQGEGRVHWSANFDEIQDFERDIRDSFEGSGFMSEGEYNARKDGSGVYDPFGKSAVGVSRELDGLAAYLTSLARVPRSPFRNADGTFTERARAGREVFERAGCPQCHNGDDFTDSTAGTLHDVGTILPTSGARLGGPLKGFDTPTLKGLWQTAPYLHDGRAATLMEIFTKYNAGDRMGVTSNLTTGELEDMVEYLMELDDEPVVGPDTIDPAPAGCVRCAVTSSGFGDARASSEFVLTLMMSVVVLAGRRSRCRCRRR